MASLSSFIASPRDAAVLDDRPRLLERRVAFFKPTVPFEALAFVEDFFVPLLLVLRLPLVVAFPADFVAAAFLPVEDLLTEVLFFAVDARLLAGFVLAALLELVLFVEELAPRVVFFAVVLAVVPFLAVELLRVPEDFFVVADLVVALLLAIVLPVVRFVAVFTAPFLAAADFFAVLDLVAEVFVDLPAAALPLARFELDAALDFRPVVFLAVVLFLVAVLFPEGDLLTAFLVAVFLVAVDLLAAAFLEPLFLAVVDFLAVVPFFPAADFFVEAFLVDPPFLVDEARLAPDARRLFFSLVPPESEPELSLPISFSAIMTFSCLKFFQLERDDTCA